MFLPVLLYVYPSTYLTRAMAGSTEPSTQLSSGAPSLECLPPNIPSLLGCKVLWARHLYPEQNLCLCLACGLNEMPPGASRLWPTGLWFQKGGRKVDCLHCPTCTSHVRMNVWDWAARIVLTCQFWVTKLFKGTGRGHTKCVSGSYPWGGCASRILIPKFFRNEIVCFPTLKDHHIINIIFGGGNSWRIYGAKSIIGSWAQFLES